MVGNYIYSLLLGMSVPDVSGKAIANLEVESLQARQADLPRRHDLRRDRGARQDRVAARRTTAASCYVETRGYKQDGTVVCTFRRKVMVPKRSYGETRGGEQPGRPRPCECCAVLEHGAPLTTGGHGTARRVGRGRECCAVL